MGRRCHTRCFPGLCLHITPMERERGEGEYDMDSLPSTLASSPTSSLCLDIAFSSDESSSTGAGTANIREMRERVSPASHPLHINTGCSVFTELQFLSDATIQIIYVLSLQVRSILVLIRLTCALTATLDQEAYSVSKAFTKFIP